MDKVWVVLLAGSPFSAFLLWTAWLVSDALGDGGGRELPPIDGAVRRQA